MNTLNLLAHPLLGFLAMPMLVVGSLLAGCAPYNVAPRPIGTTQDRITASDETETRKRARVRLELATAYYSRGQITTALDEVKQSIAADPSLSEAYNLRGLIYAGLGDEAMAEESYRYALQLDARDGDAMHNYGWYLCQKERYDEAETLFARALQSPQYLNSVRTLLTQGVCQARAGRLAEAERTLLRSYELDSANPATAVNLSEVLYRRGDLERARFYIGRVNDSDQEANAQALWLAIRIEHKAGSSQRVAELGFKLRRLFPESRETALFERKKFDD